MTDKTVNVPWKLHTNKIEINFVVINELETKFLAYVDFANAKPYFQISLLKSKLFKVFLKTLYADKI